MEQSTTAVIKRPPEDVWDYVADLAKTPMWRTTVTSIDPPGHLRVGERFSGTTKVLGRTWRWEMALTDVDVGRRLGYVVVAGVVKPSVTYVIEPDPEGSRFTLIGTIEKFGLAGRLLQPVAVPVLRRETEAHLQNLKKLLEAA